MKTTNCESSVPTLRVVNTPSTRLELTSSPVSTSATVMPLTSLGMCPVIFSSAVLMFACARTAVRTAGAGAERGAERRPHRVVAAAAVYEQRRHLSLAERLRPPLDPRNALRRRQELAARRQALLGVRVGDRAAGGRPGEPGRRAAGAVDVDLLRLVADGGRGLQPGRVELRRVGRRFGAEVLSLVIEREVLVGACVAAGVEVGGNAPGLDRQAEAAVGDVARLRVVRPPLLPELKPPPVRHALRRRLRAGVETHVLSLGSQGTPTTAVPGPEQAAPHAAAFGGSSFTRLPGWPAQAWLTAMAALLPMMSSRGSSVSSVGTILRTSGELTMAKAEKWVLVQLSVVGEEGGQPCVRLGQPSRPT